MLTIIDIFDEIVDTYLYGSKYHMPNNIDVHFMMCDLMSDVIVNGEYH